MNYLRSNRYPQFKNSVSKLSIDHPSKPCESTASTNKYVECKTEQKILELQAYITNTLRVENTPTIKYELIKRFATLIRLCKEEFLELSYEKRAIELLNDINDSAIRYEREIMSKHEEIKKSTIQKQLHTVINTLFNGTANIEQFNGETSQDRLLPCIEELKKIEKNSNFIMGSIATIKLSNDELFKSLKATTKNICCSTYKKEVKVNSFIEEPLSFSYDKEQISILNKFKLDFKQIQRDWEILTKSLLTYTKYIKQNDLKIADIYYNDLSTRVEKISININNLNNKLATIPLESPNIKETAIENENKLLKERIALISSQNDFSTIKCYTNRNPYGYDSMSKINYNTPLAQTILTERDPAAQGIADYKSKLQELQTLINDTKHDKRQEHQIEQLIKLFTKHAEESVSSLKNTTVQLNNRIENIVSKISIVQISFNSKLNRKNDEIKSLKAKETKLKNGLISNSKNYELEIKQLVSKCKQYDISIEKLQESNKESDQKVSLSIESNNRLLLIKEKAIRLAEEQIGERENKIAELSQTNQEISDKLDKTLDLINSIKQKYNSQIYQLEAEIQTSNGNKGKLEADYSHLLGKYNNLFQKYESLTNEQPLNQEIDQMKSQIKELKYENENKCDEILKAQEEIKEHQEFYKSISEIIYEQQNTRCSNELIIAQISAMKEQCNSLQNESTEKELHHIASLLKIKENVDISQLCLLIQEKIKQIAYNVDAETITCIGSIITDKIIEVANEEQQSCVMKYHGKIAELTQANTELLKKIKKIEESFDNKKKKLTYRISAANSINICNKFKDVLIEELSNLKLEISTLQIENKSYIDHIEELKNTVKKINEALLTQTEHNSMKDQEKDKMILQVEHDLQAHKDKVNELNQLLQQSHINFKEEISKFTEELEQCTNELQKRMIAKESHVVKFICSLPQKE